MNRVVLSGLLAGVPRIAYTPCGTAVVWFRIVVACSPAPQEQAAASDKILCVASGDQAVEFYAWGERGIRVNLEGRLCTGDTRLTGGSQAQGPHVRVTHAYPVLPGPRG